MTGSFMLRPFYQQEKRQWFPLADKTGWAAKLMCKYNKTEWDKITLCST
jgi:hypothetical protein